MISDALADAATRTAQSLGLRTEPVLSYLANRIRIGTREVPYSVVTALDAEPAPDAEDGIVLNQWAADDLRAKVGDAVALEYYVWKSDGALHTETAMFHVERVVPAGAVIITSKVLPAAMNTSVCTRGAVVACGMRLPSSAIKVNPVTVADPPVPLKPVVCDPTMAGTCMREPAFTRRTRTLPVIVAVAVPEVAGNSDSVGLALLKPTPLIR